MIEMMSVRRKASGTPGGVSGGDKRETTEEE